MSNIPNWLWFLVALLIILAVLWLVGIRFHAGSSVVFMTPLASRLPSFRRSNNGTCSHTV